MGKKHIQEWFKTRRGFDIAVAVEADTGMVWTEDYGRDISCAVTVWKDGKNLGEAGGSGTRKSAARAQVAS